MCDIPQADPVLRHSALPPEVCAESPGFDLGELFNPGQSGIRLGRHVK